eukprot:5648346-Ditylum_brightwellii.AAC.1
MEYLRRFGSEDHLSRLRGEEVGVEEDTPALIGGMEQLSLSDGGETEMTPVFTSQEVALTKQRKNRHRENTKHDTRTLTALLQACSNAVESCGLGNMWEGKDNLGFLDETSLRLIRARVLPNYAEKYIPGVSGIDVGLGSTTWDGDLSEDGNKLKSKTLRARGQVKGWQDLDVGHTMEDLPEQYYQMFKNDMKDEDDINQGLALMEGNMN